MLALRVALRYLFARKSHAAVNVISMISTAGIAVASLAMVCVLSVFNGFSDLAGERLSAIDPEIKVSRPYGAVIPDGDSLVNIIERIDGVAAVRRVLEQRALAISDGEQMPVRVRGIDASYADVSSLPSLVIDGEMIDAPESPYALLSIGVAISTGARPSPELPFVLTAPRRLGRINPAFPMAAFRSDTLYVSGVYQSNQGEYDEDLVYIPLASARTLFDYSTEVTSLDIAVTPGTDPADIVTAIERQLGDGYIVADRLRQQDASFRMIRIEKWITFLMLLFVLVMASFNILSTMSMLIIEKEDNMRILTALGASRSMLRRIFLYEGMLIAIIGGAIGILTGVILCLLQQHYGLISLGGDPTQLTITYYPCRPAIPDILLTVSVVLIIGYLSGLISSRSVRP
ncbi:MAG: ABC transporter permease [Bacteroides sp.]|nr:ABC transporter permease [Bacteroides sp.]